MLVPGLAKVYPAEARDHLIQFRMLPDEVPVGVPHCPQALTWICMRIARGGQVGQEDPEGLARLFLQQCFLAFEVFVDGRGTVLDLLGHPPDRHRLPSFLRRDLAGRIEDGLPHLQPLPIPPFLDPHYLCHQPLCVVCTTSVWSPRRGQPLCVVCTTSVWSPAG